MKKTSIGNLLYVKKGSLKSLLFLKEIKSARALKTMHANGRWKAKMQGRITFAKNFKKMKSKVIVGIVLTLLLTGMLTFSSQTTRASSTLVLENANVAANETIISSSDEWHTQTCVKHSKLGSQKEQTSVAPDNFQPLTTPLGGPLVNPPVGPSPTADHWWIIDYWDTASGGSLPPYMTGEFIAEANTFEGLQSGWDGLTPWADAVLYLPLNVAYGTSSTNCVWFQFDIQFVQPGLSWPFPNAIEWYIWDIRGPGTSDSDYKRTSIGIDYVVGHHYWFALIPSGTNTITFYITDETTSASWSKNDWHWTIPSTNMLADEYMFSPASCVEGYTTSSTLSGTPFLQTMAGETITVNRYISTGNQIPSGITTDRISIGSYNLWYWMMLTPGSRPDPKISSVTYPSSIDVGEAATIDVNAINNGGTSVWQTIAISFPSWESINSLSIIQSDLTSYGIHNPGETVNAAYGVTTLSLDNYLVEGVAYWPQSVTHNLKISVEPASTGSFTFYIKSVAAAKNFASNWDPKSGTKDQQLEFVYNYIISVGVNPSSISIGVNPSQIVIGSGTTISGTVSSSVPGDFSGTVYLQYSTDNVNWIDIGSTTSSSSGDYSYWWTPSSTATFYVRSFWNGNSNYGGATSSSVTLTVTSGAGNLGDHTMCKGVQSVYPWDAIDRTNTFYTDDYAAYSWLHFNGPIYGSHTVHWDWYDPDGSFITDSTGTIPDAKDSGYDYWEWYRISSGLLVDGYQSWYSSRLGRPFRTEVFYDGSPVVTETWQVIKHDSSISASLSSNSITYGQSVTVSSQVTPSMSDGATTLQYSIDQVNWMDISAGTPSNGYYSVSWAPPNAGTYYLRATWSGNLNYYGSTSSSKALTVSRASTSLTTSLSSTMITYGSSVTIEVSMSPSLQGKTVVIQYSLDEANWFDLSSGTTNAAGQYASSWSPVAGSFYIRSTWSGDANYHGTASSGQQLTVNKASTSTSCSLSSNSINYGQSVDITGTVNIAVNDGTITLEYSTDCVDWNLISSGTPLSGSYLYTWIPPSGGIFYVRAAWSGNHNYLGSTSLSQTLTVIMDSTPPETTITSSPSGIIHYNDVSFSWTGSDDVSATVDLLYSYYLVGFDSDWSLWTSGTSKQYYDLLEGDYVFKVKAKDQADNVDPTPDENPFTVDTTAPTIVGHTPTGTDVPITTTITVTFSEAMNHASAENAFSINPSVSGSFSWSGNTMVFTLDSDLVYDTTYEVTIDRGAMDLAGNPLQLHHNWEFTTTMPPNEPPSILDIYPNSGIVYQGDSIRIYCNSSDLETPEISLTCKIWIRPTGKPWIVSDGTMSWDGSNHYYDWNIPTSAEPGYYDVNCTVSDGELSNSRTDYDEFEVLCAYAANTYLVVRGLNNRIYYRLYNSSSGSWKGWNVVPNGATCDSPVAAAYSGKLYIIVRGMDGQSLWFGWINLTDKSFHDWTKLSGLTPSTPTLTSNGTALYLVVRGMNNRIYYRFYDCVSDTWEEWNAVPTGATCDSPAAAMLGGNLSIVVRGMDEYSLWHGSVNLTTEVFQGWTRLPGQTSSVPTLTSNQTLNRLYLVVRGLNDRIYYNAWNGVGWEGWIALPTGTTCDGPATAVIGDRLHFVVRGMDGNTLWHGYLEDPADPESFSGWSWLSGATSSAPTLTVEEYLRFGWLEQWSYIYGVDGHSQFAQPIGDIDEDGVNEIIVGGYEALGSGVVRILSYDATAGTYVEEYSWTHGGGTYNAPSGASVVDLDDDGDLELVVSWAYSGVNDGVWAYDWDGVTLVELDHYYASFVFDVYTCDYNDDGDMEVLIANAPWGGTPYHVIALGWQGGQFVEEAMWLLDGYSWECPMIWSGDTDNDGKTEVILVISDSYYSTAGVWALNWNQTLNEWEEQLVYAGPFLGTPYGVTVGDIDGDGTPEIGVGNNIAGNVGAAAYLFEWNGTAYEKVWESSWSGEYCVIEAVAIGDADNDGINEFCVGGGYAHIIEWTGTNYAETATITKTAGLLAGLVIGDCDTDGLNEMKACDILGLGPGKEWIFKYSPVQ